MVKHYKNGETKRPLGLPAGHCTAADYRRLFVSSAEEFRWLSHTLTGEHARAEISLGNAFDQLLEDDSLVFREWITNWARRLIIKSCIATMREALRKSAQKLSRQQLVPAYSSDAALMLPELSPESLQACLLRLDLLSRFVLVLRMMEKYSRRETALLLEIDERICDVAQQLAMEELATRCSPSGLTAMRAASC